MKSFIRSAACPSRRFHGLFIQAVWTALCIVLLLTLRPARADELTDARALLTSGKPAEALVIADNYLAQKPNDAHMLFLKGLILTQQDQSAKAIAVFSKLAEEYPALPEPYNNLAVLYASSGQYDKARASLEMAIRTNPSYATAYENLGDIYAKLASQAYDKALQTNTASSSAKAKLAMIHTLVGTTAPGAKAPTVTTVAAASKPAPATSVTPPKAEPKPTPEVKPASKPEPKPASKPEAAGSADRDEVARTLNEWAAAWSNKDVKKYLGHYASDFKTPKGVSRKAWADERTSRITGKGRISVKIESPQISIAGNIATVKFRQGYTSDRLSVSSKKTMVFVKSGGKWKIQQEQSN